MSLRVLRPVLVVGAGVSGAACARTLADAGVPVRLVDRGRRAGGRMAVRTVDQRPVDVGASYFTVSDDAFRAVVDGWVGQGLAHPWTDTFHLGSPDGPAGTTTGPMRYASRRGLRSLVEELLGDLPLEHPVDVAEVVPGPHVDGKSVTAVVLAMPDPQARDLLSEDLRVEVERVEDRGWEPSLALYAGWARRTWPRLDGVFVEDSPVLSFIADDGRCRGDGAPVLVAHAPPVFAAARLDEPDLAREPMLAELSLVLGIEEPPRWAHVTRWSLSRPREGRAERYHLGPAMVGLCGDGWAERSRVEAAYLSGQALGRALVDRLTGAQASGVRGPATRGGAPSTSGWSPGR